MLCKTGEHDQSIKIAKSFGRNALDNFSDSGHADQLSLASSLNGSIIQEAKSSKGFFFKKK